jgi:alpha-ketoglutarate-dependent taurine dioxygenase
MKEEGSEGAVARQKLFSMRQNLRPRAISPSQEDWIETGLLTNNQTLPLVIRPAIEGVNLSQWAVSHADFIHKKLHEHGGILFRGFDVCDQNSFEGFVEGLCPQLMHYIEGATPRTQLSDNIYTSTEYPSEHTIALHNELTYVISWPMKIWFYCLVPPEQGGSTPIADVRKVLKMIDPSIVKRFREKKWMLVRNYGDGLSLPWQAAFRTNDPKVAEEYCRNGQIEYQWRADGGLRTSQVRQAIRTHYTTGEEVWFNHVAFWHVSSLEQNVREAMLSVYSEEGLPFNTYYGDGGQIESSIVGELRQAYREAEVEFAWQKTDILMLDNMLAAHGRNPFTGPRRILVAMGDPSPSISA